MQKKCNISNLKSFHNPISCAKDQEISPAPVNPLLLKNSHVVICACVHSLAYLLLFIGVFFYANSRQGRWETEVVSYCVAKIMSQIWTQDHTSNTHIVPDKKKKAKICAETIDVIQGIMCQSNDNSQFLRLQYPLSTLNIVIGNTSFYSICNAVSIFWINIKHGVYVPTENWKQLYSRFLRRLWNL